MNLTTHGNITSRKDGLPYDVLKVGKGIYQFRAIGNPEKPVVLATAGYTEALMMLVAQAPEFN